MYRSAVLTLVLAWGSPAWGQTETSTATEASDAAAAEYADAGRLFYQNGQYVEALESFQNALRLGPTAALNYNIARCYEKLSQWRDAITYYERYLEMEKNPRDRSEVLDKLELLRSRAGGDSPDAAFDARMESGRTAYQRGDYEAAIAEFLAAFALKQDPAAVYNVAKSYERLARYEEAIDYFEQYLELAPEASDRADVEATITQLRKAIRERFQELVVSSQPPGADIYLDDRETGLVGQTNFTFKVTPGPHTIFVDLNGYEPIEREFVMPDDKPLALDFQLVELENVGELLVNVSLDGARIFVDGAIVGLSPLTQKKKLEQGTHQVQVELPGYNRFTQEVEIVRDQLTTIDAELVKYDPGISDETLTDWGRNLLLVGVIGGAAGILTPFLYQEFVLQRDYYSPLGPRDVDGNRFYRGPDGGNLQNNTEFETFEQIQLASIIAGSTLAAAGLTFYFIKWFRKSPPPPPPGLAAEPGPGPFRVRVDQFGAVPLGNDGMAVGVSGRF